jgi:hypothetical protein
MTRAVAGGRPPSPRLRVDPATCNRDYSREHLEFMRAMDDYKRAANRPFPTLSEHLDVLLTLGYQKQS